MDDLTFPALNFSEDNDIPKFPCIFRSPDNLTNVFNNYNKGAFSLLTFNVRSCRKNFGSFVSFLSGMMFRFSVIILVETWLSSGADCGFDIGGYKHIDILRNNFGGGIRMYYNEMFNAELISDLTIINDCMEVLTVYLIGLNFKYIICSVYRSPGANPHVFNEEFLNILNKFPVNAKVIITGDFNLNLFNFLRSTYIDLFIGSMLSCGFYPVITLPTKINDGNSVTPYSLLDQIWVNFKAGSEHDSGVVMFPLTDHFPVYFMFKGDCQAGCKKVVSRLINPNTITNFVSLISNANFGPVYYGNDVNMAFNLFWEILWKLYNSCFPVKRKKVKSNIINAPWMTPDLKKCIKKKYRLFNYLRKGLIQKRQFIMYKNALTWLINKMRRKYYHEKFENCRNNSSRTWLNVNQILGRNIQEPVSRIITDSGMKVEGPSLAEHFNSYFTSIVSRLTASLPRNINFNYLRTLDGVPHSCFLLPTDEFEVVDILRGMPNKGNSLIDIKPNILLLISNIIGKCIAYLYNFSIRCGIYPDLLKTGRVTPAFKSGDISKISNYRPITNLLNI